MSLSPEQRIEVLESLSRSIIEAERRVEHWQGPPDKLAIVARKLATMRDARNVIEAEGASA